MRNVGYNQKGRGRKTLLNNEQKEVVKKWVKEQPKNLEKVKEKIEDKFSEKIKKNSISYG